MLSRVSGSKRRATAMRLPDPLKRFMALWLIGGFATVVGLAVLSGVVLENHGWWGYLRLVNAGVTTQAVIVLTDRENHCLAEYSFVVDGRTYSGSGTDCQVQVGQDVVITYLRWEPKHSCLGLARDALGNELMGFLAGGVVFPPFVLFALRWSGRGRARSADPESREAT